MIKQTYRIEFKNLHVTLSLVEARHVGRLQPPDALDWDSSNCKIRGPDRYHQICLFKTILMVPSRQIYINFTRLCLKKTKKKQRARKSGISHSILNKIANYKEHEDQKNIRSGLVFYFNQFGQEIYLDEVVKSYSETGLLQSIQVTIFEGNCMVSFRDDQGRVILVVQAWGNE